MMAKAVPLHNVFRTDDLKIMVVVVHLPMLVFLKKKKKKKDGML